MDFVADLQAALTQAQNHAGPDTIRAGGGPLDRMGGFSYNSPDAVHIEGNGGRFHGTAERTYLRETTPNAINKTVLTVLGSNQSTISGIDVTIPGGTGSGNIGIDTSATVDNVLVQRAAGSTASIGPRGVLLRGGSSLTNSDVLLGVTPSTSGGVGADGPSITISDVRVEAAEAIFTNQADSSVSIRRAEVHFASTGVGVTGGTVSVDDSLLVYGNQSGASTGAMIVNTTADDGAIAANHVTVIGHAGTISGTALSSAASGAGKADLSFRNGIVSGFGKRFYRNATGTGAANITTDFSDYSPGVDTDNGPGAITETNHLDVPPGFLSSTDYHLAPGSPLIEAADPAETGGLDGDGDCAGRRDIGAFEFMPGPRAPKAVVSGPFDASGSCDPDGDPLTFSWAFDDGASADGAVVQHTFATPGLHLGTVTVTDSTGRSATATASTTVSPSPFPGLVLKDQRIRASKKRLVKVAVECPAGTVDFCAGSFALTGKSTSLFFAPNTKHKVQRKLSKKTFKQLKKKKRLSRTATATAHDGNGSEHTTTATITLLRPKK